MKGLQEKWKSQSGASIILALLFLLVCMMVAASILMAAVSNAGKLHSNRTEQQKYLTLSSALRLVCGELNAVSYRGKYSYEREEIMRTELDMNGDPIEVHDYYLNTYTQLSGAFEKGGLNAFQPFGNELDALFANIFVAAQSSYPDTGSIADERYIFEPLGSAAFTGGPYVLTLAVVLDPDTHPELAGLAEPVTITVKMREDGVLQLKATLGAAEADGYVYTMEAELTPEPSLSTALAIKDKDSAVSGENETGTVTWKLNWIAKRGRQADEGETA